MSAAAEKIGFLRAVLGEPEGRPRAALGHTQADACLKGGILIGALHEVFPAEPGDEAAAAGFAVTLTARAAADRHLLWCGTDFAALEHGEISAPGLLELGLDPDRFLLLRAPDAVSILRAGFDALSCAALGAIVLEIPGAPKVLDLSASRRLVLAAAASGVTAFLLRLDAQVEASAAETRWLVRTARSQTVTFPPPHFAGEVARPRPCAGGCAGGGKWVRRGPPPPLRGTSPTLRAGEERQNGGGKEGAEQIEDWGYPRFDAEIVRHRHGRNGHWVMEWNCDDGVFRAADAGAVVSAAADRPAQAENAKHVA
jgi:protein ImuA